MVSFRTVRVVLLLVAFALPAGAARAAERNACGCTQTDSGNCICDKKARCGCPGQCEPQGCEAQREKAFQREVETETRKARDTDRQHAATKDEAAPRVTPAPAPAPARAAAMTPVQQKQLLHLLDLYLAAHPGARATSAGELRDQISPSPGRR